tara:strand:- start:5271 stop:5924 length:654 start_codon:yes stop_codon:yes gene_type:complete
LDISYILKTIWESDKKGWGAAARLKANHPEVSSYLDDIYPAIGSNKSKQAWLFVNNLMCIPCCYCGKECEFLGFSRGFRKFCSTKCMANSNEVKEKIATTTFDRHGGSFFSKDQFKQTMVEKYGVANAGQMESNKKSRAKKKSDTYILQKISEVEKQYVPMFEIVNFLGVHEPSQWKCLTCQECFEQKNMTYTELNCSSCFPIKNLGKSKLETEVLQ